MTKCNTIDRFECERFIGFPNTEKFLKAEAEGRGLFCFET